MLATRLISNSRFSATLYRCQAGPGDKPFAEMHDSWSIAFVRKGSFGYINRGRHFDLVPGALLIGRPGDEYICTHEHHACGDECLCFRLAPETVEAIGESGWTIGGLAPRAEFATLGALAEAAATGQSDMALEEIGLAFAAKLASLKDGDKHGAARMSAPERKRIVAAAHWIDAHAHEEIDLAAAAAEAGLSPFHFLRRFAGVVGLTPHQYLVRARLARAATDLALTDRPVTDIAFDCGFGDLSNFVRSFRRAAGLSPRAYRRRAHGISASQRTERNFRQDRNAAAA